MKISPKFKLFLKRFGLVGFLFFLIKGILWLVAGKFFYDIIFN